MGGGPACGGAHFFCFSFRPFHKTQAEVDTHKEVYTPLTMPIIRGNAKVKMLSRPYSTETTTHDSQGAATVVTLGHQGCA